MKRILTMLTVAVAVLAGLLFGAGAGGAQAAGTASVTVVHGIPNTPVNVFVNGASTLTNFQPGTVAGPLQLAPGNYEIKIFPASNTAGTGTPVIDAHATLAAGQNVSLVAHLDASGNPTLTPYVNDTSTIAAGKARLVVRHVAAGSISADVVLAGTSTVAIGPATLNLVAGSETIVYAIGSASASTLSLVVQTMTGLGGAPSGMPAGSAGLAAANVSTPLWVWTIASLGGLFALGGGAALAARGRTRLARARG
jgi:hypothetical protein